MHWMSWDKLTVHKNHGGMGFKDLKYFNIAMLRKQGWKLQTDKHSLVSRLFKARYFPNSNYLGSRIDHNPSYVWRSIFSAKNMVRSGACWCIGTGSTITLIGEPWLVNDMSIYISPSSPISAHLQYVMVDNLIDNSSKTYYSHLISRLFDPYPTKLIVSTQLFQQVTNYSMVWTTVNDGHYFVCHVYKLCMKSIAHTSHL